MTAVILIVVWITGCAVTLAAIGTSRLFTPGQRQMICLGVVLIYMGIAVLLIHSPYVQGQLGYLAEDK